MLEEGAYIIDTGVGELVPDPHNPSGWLLIVNGLESSYVDLADPTRLEFEYVSWMGIAIDLFREPKRPIRAAHLGGGGCTLPRYVAATRPGSEQVVFEVDRELLRMVTYAFQVHEIANLRFEIEDGLAGVRALPSHSYDVIIRDAFDGGDVPAHLVGRELLAEAARVLVPDGIYLANVPSEGDLAAATAEGEHAAAVFAHVGLFIGPGQLRGRRFGNVVLAASQRPLPWDELARRLHRAIAPARLVPVTDADDRHRSEGLSAASLPSRGRTGAPPGQRKPGRRRRSRRRPLP